MDHGILFTNGLAFGTDGLFYVNETATGNIYRYGMMNGSVVGPRTLFRNIIRPARPRALRVRMEWHFRPMAGSMSPFLDNMTSSWSVKRVR